MMPDRIIRDEMLRSERYWNVSIEAQRLFIHILLNVDDMARFSGKNYSLRAACYPGQAMEPDKLERLLSELVDIDLVRLYVVNGERFIFVPRFKQRLRFRNSRYPAPPNEINDIAPEKTDSSQAQDGRKSDSSPPKRREVKRSEEKRSNPFHDFWAMYPRKKSKGDAERAWAKLKPDELLVSAIIQGLLRAKTSVDWTKEGGKYIPHPATWLNAKGWEDEHEQRIEVLV